DASTCGRGDIMAISPAPSPNAWLALSAVALLTAFPARGEEAKPDPAATRQYAVAAGFQSKKLYAQAARRWQQFIAAYPKDPRLAKAYHHLASCHHPGSCQLHDRQSAKAAQTFRTLIEKFPRFESLDAAHFNLGLALYNVGLA